MRLSRRSRFLAALLALICVLFAQIAVAGYACPSMQIGQAVASIAPQAPTLDHHHEMAGCDDMDADQPLVCHDHGQSRNQSLDKPATPDVHPFIASVLLQAVNQVDAAARALAAPADRRVLTRSTSPPLAIRNCCFRI